MRTAPAQHCIAQHCSVFYSKKKYEGDGFFLFQTKKKKKKILKAQLFNLCNAQTNEIQEEGKFIIYFKINVLLGGRTRCFTHN